jgi:hypothetical protein
MAGHSGGRGSRGAGSASPAALHDDEDLMARRRKNFRAWAGKRKKKSMLINYSNSPKPPAR